MDPSWKRQKFVGLNKIVAPLPGRVTPEFLLNRNYSVFTESPLGAADERIMGCGHLQLVAEGIGTAIAIVSTKAAKELFARLG